MINNIKASDDAVKKIVSEIEDKIFEANVSRFYDEETAKIILKARSDAKKINKIIR